MDRQLIEVIIIDELVDKFLEGKQYVLAESQQNMINELVENLVESLAERMYSDKDLAALKARLVNQGYSPEEASETAAEMQGDVEGSSLAKDIEKAAAKAGIKEPKKQAPKDETPGKLDPEEKKEASGAKSDLMKTLKQKGIVGSALAGVGKVANKVFTALFGQGHLQDREDAQKMIDDINKTGVTPAQAAQKLYASLYHFKQPGQEGEGTPSPAPGPEPDPEESGAGSDFAVPVFKKFSGADQEKGAPQRSLSSQLMKQFPNVPKSAITQILKGVAAQLKTNKVAIQENKYIVAKVIIENLSIFDEASREERIAAKRQKSHRKRGKTIPGDFINPKFLKKELKDISKKLKIRFHIQDLLNNIRSLLKKSLAPSGEDDFRVQGGPKELDERAATPYVVALQDLHKATMDSSMMTPDGEKSNIKINPDDAWKISQELATWLEDFKGANVTIDRGQEDPEEEETESPEEETPGEEGGDAGETTPGEAPEKDKSEELFDKFRKTLKMLDLHTSEGREAAKASDAAYLGAYKYYKSMKLAYDAIKSGRLDVRSDRIEKLLTPLNELQGENEFAAGKDLKTWLGNMINIFDENGLNDPERGTRASKAARGASDPKEKGYTPADVKSKAGVVNVRQLVAPQLKAAGLADPTKDKQNMRAAQKKASDLKAQGKNKEARIVMQKAKQNSSGASLQRDITKMIRRFLKKNMQRMGKKDIDIIAEKLIKEMKNRGIIT